VRLVAHLSSLTERPGDRKVNSAGEGTGPVGWAVGGSEAEGHGGEAWKPGATVASSEENTPKGNSAAQQIGNQPGRDGVHRYVG
jgi:hypothetical protein